ncbi:hypothetical protein PR202_gb28402 [Eleusine coracana subsp. coracana]|uniref:C3H1-type domain-containing protein n=1 Tax=Eleusine coracana subsp. coracana TaxID=191504 RepID=A0AAV5FWZ1_ELECO|nr:hypothetical protein PR202_gb28402 [Eleusine coracana subsp. coracana]
MAHHSNFKVRPRLGSSPHRPAPFRRAGLRLRPESPDSDRSARAQYADAEEGKRPLPFKSDQGAVSCVASTLTSVTAARGVGGLNPRAGLQRRARIGSPLRPRDEPTAGALCKYGAQCRFVHASSQQQQQPKSNPFGFGTGSSQQPKSNPFGFGTGSSQQQQQPKSNPFGFGTGSTQQQQQPNSNPFGFGTGSKQQQQPSFGAQFQQQKPNPFGFGVQGGAVQSRNAPGPTKSFQNKWVRDQSAPTKQSEAAQQQPVAHTACTDPESCRQQIVEDFKNETPLWKLTCYAHLRSGPCDITGDLSFEELRAQAYEDSRQGHPLQSIVERERNIQNAKLMEFTNFLSSHSGVSQAPSFPTVPSVPEVKSNSSFGVSQSNGPPVFSSFSQVGAATNLGPGPRTGVPTNTLFGQSSHTTNQAFSAPTFGVSEMKFGVSGVDS